MDQLHEKTKRFIAAVVGGLPLGMEAKEMDQWVGNPKGLQAALDRALCPDGWGCKFFVGQQVMVVGLTAVVSKFDVHQNQISARKLGEGIVINFDTAGVWFVRYADTSVGAHTANELQPV